MSKKYFEVQGVADKIAISSLPKIIISEILTKDQLVSLGKDFKLVNFSEEHIVRLFTMRSYGMTLKEIAEKLDMPYLVIDKIVSSLEYRAVADTITSDVTTVAKDTLTLAAEKATRTLIDLLDSEDERIQFKASTEILNRTGLDSVKRVQVESKNEHIHTLPEEQLQYILKSAEIANKMRVKIADDEAESVEYEESDE